MGKLSTAKQREAFNRTVRACMARKGIKNPLELAPLIGVDTRCLYRRFRWESHWTLEDLFRLIRVLEPTADELEEMMGAKK